MDSDFSAILLAGGKSNRMGRDKAFLKIGGTPLWQRQLGTLRQLQPKEIFIAGPMRSEWSEACDEVLPDAHVNSGPLAGLLSGFHRCRTQYLVALAIDLPRITTAFLSELIKSCGLEKGVVPRFEDRSEPLAAVYPVTATAVAEAQMRAGRFSLQDFVRVCFERELIQEHRLPPSARPLFLNLNTPNDLLTLG